MSSIRAELSPAIIEHAINQVRYKIVITKYTTELIVKEKVWEEGAGDPNNEGKATWGYTPAIEDLVEVNRTVLQQEVAELDLVEVIKAVNGIVDIDMTTS